jgi:hypothetical protein
LLDANQNVLRRVGTDSAPLWVDPPPVVAQAPVEAASEARGFWKTPVPYWIGAGVLALVGGGLGLASQGADQALRDVVVNRADHSFAEVQSLDGARHAYRAGALGAGVAALGLAVTGGILW